MRVEDYSLQTGMPVRCIMYGIGEFESYRVDDKGNVEGLVVSFKEKQMQIRYTPCFKIQVDGERTLYQEHEYPWIISPVEYSELKDAELLLVDAFNENEKLLKEIAHLKGEFKKS